MKQELVIITKGPVGNSQNPHSGSYGLMKSDGLMDIFNKFDVKPIFNNSPENEPHIESFSLIAESENNIHNQQFHHTFINSNDIEQVREKIIEINGVEAAYSPPPTVNSAQPSYNNNEYEKSYSTGPTPSFVDKQIYLGPAPYGIDAQYAWTIPGGKGHRIVIIDVERAFNFYHEDRFMSQYSTIYNDDRANEAEVNHGTSVLGVLAARHDEKGIHGICPEAAMGFVSSNLFPPTYGGIATAIDQAALALMAGDIMVIEAQRFGPKYQFKQYLNGHLGMIPVEWWPAEYRAIKNATDKGIIVVEAAGNGDEWLEHPLYSDRSDHYLPPSWSNPFERKSLDSGAILVGAGNGVINGDYSKDRTRSYSSSWGSNYGNCIDAQGWGGEIITCGKGDLFYRDENSKYTANFGGTSGATAMVAGALACVQGVLQGANKPLLTPTTARQLLRRTGSPQIVPPNDITLGSGMNLMEKRIGNRPNLKEMINEALKM